MPPHPQPIRWLSLAAHYRHNGHASILNQSQLGMIKDDVGKADGNAPRIKRNEHNLGRWKYRLDSSATSVETDLVDWKGWPDWETSGCMKSEGFSRRRFGDIYMEGLYCVL